MEFATKAIHIGSEPDSKTGSVIFPIYQTSTYAQEDPGVTKGFAYSRTENPSRQALEQNLAALEDAKYGVAFASGLSAVNTVLNILKSGDHIIAGKDLYGGTYRIFTKLYEKYGFEFSFVDTTDLANIESHLKPNTKVIWIETPSNPLLLVSDIKGAAGLAKKRRINLPLPQATGAPSERNILVVVDNTFATPYISQPLALGADIVLHSTTKYLGGHSDVIGGALISNDKGLYEQLKFYQNTVGAVPGPMDCFLIQRGTKTLALRMEKHCENARAVANFLKEHKKVARVYFPGLPEHPGHKVAKTQMKDFGGMVSFEVKGGFEDTRKVARSTKIFALAESLGTIRSLINHPATMTHASVPAEVRRANGVSDSLLRLSVGVEAVADIIADLERALA